MKKKNDLEEILKKIILSEVAINWWREEMSSLLEDINKEEKKGVVGGVDEKKIEKLNKKADYLVRKGEFEINEIDKILAGIEEYVKKKKE
jgi:hypothetical protein